MIRVFRFSGRTGIRSRDTLVHDIAEQVLPFVMRLLHIDTMAMSAAELRGYVRARAWQAVRAEILQLITERCVPASQEGELIDAVLERIGQLVFREHFAPPVVSIPMPHIRLRIAA